MSQQPRVRGVELYAAIMKTLKTEPRTGQALAEALGGLELNHLRRTLRLLQAHRLVYICAWDGESGFQKSPRAIWAAGKSNDAPPPITRNGVHAVKLADAAPARRKLLDAFATMWHDMSRAECTAHELSEFSGVGRCTVYRLIRTMRDHGLIRISSWQRRSEKRASTDYMPRFKLGRGPDVPRPARMTPTEVSARYEHRKREHQQRLSLVRHTHPFDLMASQLAGA